MNIEEQLATLAAATRWDDIPPVVREYATALTIDALANAVAGRAAETVPEYEAAARVLAGPGVHAVCAGPPMAAWGATGQNAYQMTVYTMCDVYRPALCHVTPEVVPAALAAAELADASTADFLLAVTLGMEVTVRVCQALDYPTFRARGWHSPGVAGALGAAAAAGRLLGLDVTAMTGCLGLAGAQAAGTFAAMGTVAVKFHQANGARAGLAAAVYAARGFAGSRAILTTPDGGILATYAGGGRPDLANSVNWLLTGISMRSYPAASTLQSLVDCLLPLDARPGHVTVWLPAHAYRLGNGGWDNQLAAMQSARFVASAVLHRGTCWLDTFGQESRDDPAITGYAAGNVDVLEDGALPEGGVRIRWDDKETRRDYPHGDSRDPLITSEVEAKAIRSLAAAMPQARAAAAGTALAGLADPAPIDRLTGLLTVAEEA
jgi:2-methylcitrate dehydratase PrpD